MKKIRIEHSIFLGLCIFFLTLAVNIDYHRVVNYLFSDEAVYYMMAQSFAYDQDLEYTQQDLFRVYRDGWHLGPQGVFLNKILDYRLTERSFQQLQQQPIPQDVLAKLRTLSNQNISTQEKFLSAVRHTIGAEHTQKYISLILQAAETENERIYYSKSFVYALFLAPFVLLFGFNGFLLLNMGLLLFMIWMGWRYLQQFNSRSTSLFISAIFFLVSASFIYTFWITPEVFNMFCITLGLFLWLYRSKKQGIRVQKTYTRKKSGFGGFLFAPLTLGKWLVTTPEGRLYLAPVPIAIAAASKLPNALFILPIVADLFVESYRGIFYRETGSFAGTSRMPLRWKSQRIWRYLGKLVLISLLFWLIFLSSYVFQYVLTGHFNPYAGDRKAFYWKFPFSVGSDVWEQGFRLSNDDYFEKSFFFHPKVFLYNIYYYLFGRFTGMLPYFCCSFLALWYFFSSTRRRKEYQQESLHKRWLLLLTIVASILSYIFMAPTNYQGGGGAFGNRFFVNIYPAFLFLITGISSLRPLMVAWLVGAIFLAQSLINPFQTSFSPAPHAYRGLYRFLPVELSIVETLPTLVNPHLMQLLHDETPPFRLYFADDHIYDITPSGFWVRGEETTEFIIRAYDPQEYLALTLMNGPVENQVDVTVSGVTQTVIFDAAHETRRLIFPLQWSMPYFDNRLYPVKIRSHHSYIPRFTGESGLNLPYPLGCHVGLSFNPLEIGKALRENQQPQQAIQILTSLVAAHPKDIHARYELAQAYQQADLPEAAEQELLHCQALLPKFRQKITSHCQTLGEACTKEHISDDIEIETASGLVRFLHPLIRRYEAENLSHNTGKELFWQEASNNKVAVFTPETDVAGFLVFGPFSEYQPGTYQARFRINLQTSQETQTFPSGPALFIEVFHKKLGILARQAISLETGLSAKSTPFQDYTLNFALAYPGILEFRVQTTGTARVSVDKIDVYQRLPLQIYETLAQNNLQQGNVYSALELTQELLKVDPWTPKLQIEYLQILHQTSQWKQALEFLTGNPHVSEIQTGIASVLFDSLPQIDHQDLRRFLEELYQTFIPNIPFYTEFSDRIAFVGYDISASTLAPGEHFSVEYIWKALDTMNADYAFFVHFSKKGGWVESETIAKIKRRLGLGGQQMFQQDHEPLNGAYPTSNWIPGEWVRERYEVIVPSDLEPGTYEIWIGVWNPLTKTRLQSDNASKIKIGEIVIWPKNGSNG